MFIDVKLSFILTRLVVVGGMIIVSLIIAIIIIISEFIISWLLIMFVNFTILF